MSKAEAQPSHNKISKEMSEFYLALGAFNANMVARITSNPGALKNVTKHIIAVACPDHDAQCPDGFMWNHVNNSCLKLRSFENEG